MTLCNELFFLGVFLFGFFGTLVLILSMSKLDLNFLIIFDQKMVVGLGLRQFLFEELVLVKSLLK